MPPASRSRSITVTGSMPRLCSSIAVASPEGPPPTMRGPSSIGIRCPFDRRRDLRPAEEPLAAAHQRAGTATQPVGVGRRDLAAESTIDLAAGDPLAEADDPPVVGVSADQLGVLVGTGAELADVGHLQQGLGAGVRELEPPVR